MSHFTLDRLEHRTLLSVSIVDHVIHVDGTPGSDKITIVEKQGHARITINGKSQTLSTAGFHRMQVDGAAGNDRINYKGTLACTLSGGAGNDLLYADGGAVRQRLNGGPGNDTLRGSRNAHDVLYGGPGKDNCLDSNDNLADRTSDDTPSQIIIGGTVTQEGPQQPGNVLLTAGDPYWMTHDMLQNLPTNPIFRTSSPRPVQPVIGGPVG